MKKIILGILIGVLITFSGYALATTYISNGQIIDDGIQFLRGSFETGEDTDIESFIDTKTGVTCYVATHYVYSGESVAISCVK